MYLSEAGYQALEYSYLATAVLVVALALFTCLQTGCCKKSKRASSGYPEIKRWNALPREENYLGSIQGGGESSNSPTMEMQYCNQPHLLRREWEYSVERHPGDSTISTDVEDETSAEHHYLADDSVSNPLYTRRNSSMDFEDHLYGTDSNGISRDSLEESEETRTPEDVAIWQDIYGNLNQNPSDESDGSLIRRISELLIDTPPFTPEMELHSDVYDSDFEDPRLFFQSEGRTAYVQDSSRQEQVETMGKHLWPCVVCVEKPPETVFTPCSHAACCQECASQVRIRGSCPVCLSRVDDVDRVFFTQSTCVVCMDSPPEVIFRPCCHAVCCRDCTCTIVNGNEQIRAEGKCPICKAYINETDFFLLAYS